MRAYRFAVATLAAVTAFAIGGIVGSGQQPPSTTPQVAAPAPLGAQGEAIYPAFEGWGPHKDGTNYVLLGYYNRNKDQTIDVPIGPNNRIEPGGPDLLQPTHFEPGRAWGVFAVQVPKDFGTKKFTWTLVANGKQSQVQVWTNPPYWVDFFKNAAKGNTPPVIKFAENGPEMSGPPTGLAATLNATVNTPLKLTLWAKDKPNTYDPEEGLPPEQRSQARGRGGRGRGAAAGTDTDAAAAGATPAAGSTPAAGAAPAAAAGGAQAGGRGRGAAAPNFDVSAATGRGAPIGRAGGGPGGRGAGPQPDVTVTWKVHRGSSPVKFADEVIRLFNQGNADAVMEATTTATFTVPGEYMLRAQVNDNSGDGGNGEQCCWTDALVKVTVK